MAGLLRPAGGLIQPAGLSGGGIAYLPQHAEIEKRFPISVIQTVLLGHWHRIGWAGALTPELSEGANELSARLALRGSSGDTSRPCPPGSSSASCFARLIVQDAELILLDEPLVAVDWHTSEDLLRLIVGWQGEGRTVVAVLHDLDQVRAYFPNTLLLARERVAWGPTQEALMPQNLQRARHISETWSDEGENNRPLRDRGGPGCPVTPTLSRPLPNPPPLAGKGRGRSGEREGSA